MDGVLLGNDDVGETSRADMHGVRIARVQADSLVGSCCVVRMSYVYAKRIVMSVMYNERFCAGETRS